jgi:hypothetical protein
MYLPQGARPAGCTYCPCTNPSVVAM